MDRNRRIPNRIIGLLALLSALLTGVSLGPVEGPVIGETTHVTYLTDDGRDIHEDRNTGLKSVIRPPNKVEVNSLTSPLAPQLNWVNLDVLDGKEMVWCLQDTQYETFRTAMRSMLNQMASIENPDKIKWREACPAPYSIGDDSTQICGQGSLGCASVAGLSFRSAKISVAREMIENGSLREGLYLVALHEGLHAVTTSDHTGCGSVPDGEPSLMSPFDTSRQLPCHVPAATSIQLPDYKAAGPKYGLTFGVQPTVVPTASPTPVTTVAFRRWTLPSWGESCQPNSGEWCVDSEFRLPPNHFAWFQSVRIQDGREQHVSWIEVQPFQNVQQALGVSPTPPSR